MKKLFILIFILAVLSGGAYYAQKNDWLAKIKNKEFFNEKNSKNNFKIWQNEAYGFELSYPSGYEFSESKDGYEVGEFFLGKGIYLGRINLPENSYPGSNFFSGFLNFSASATETPDSCRRANQEGSEQIIELADSKLINGVKFWRGKAIGAAAGTLAESIIWHGFYDGVCYEVTFNTFEGNIGNYPEGTVVQFDKNDAQTKIESVLETMHFKEGPVNFLAKYLEAYKNIAEKKNFQEVKNFLRSDEIGRMAKENTSLETNYTAFDNFEVVSVKKQDDHFLAEMELYRNGKALKKPGENAAISVKIFREDGSYKTSDWYFVQ
ncbi:MAG: hypothetical protein PHQ47_01095 [Candidatus Portnoybacteria bacterium]|nr:hypothetical protein [Candidatus Portnoybacteria bacterium]